VGTEKNHLDIKLKKEELEEKNSLVRPATFEEVDMVEKEGVWLGDTMSRFAAV